MFKDIVRKQEEEKNKAQAERNKVLLSHVEGILDLLKRGGVTVNEAVNIVENVKSRINGSVISRNIADFI